METSDDMNDTMEISDNINDIIRVSGEAIQDNRDDVVEKSD
jgi:hypothetical protein